MKNLLRLGVAQYLVVLGQFVTGPLIARSLGPSERGILAILLSVQLLYPVLVSLGLGARIRAAAAGGVEWSKVSALLRKVTAVAGFLSLGLVALVLMRFPLDTHVAVSAALMIASAPFLIYRNSLLSAAVSFGNFKAIERNSKFQATANIVVALVLFAMNSLTLLSMTIFYAALAIVSTLILIPFPWRSEVTDAGMPPFKYGVAAYPAQVLEASYGRIDQFLVMGIAGPSAAGLFAISYSYAVMLLPFLHSRSVVLGGGESPGSASRRKLSHRSLLIALGATLGATCLAPIVIPILFGSEYRDSVLPAQIMVVGVLAYGLSLQIVQKNLENGRAQLNSLGYGAGACVTIILGSLFGSLYGLVGFAMAFLVSGICMLLSLMNLERRQKA